MELRRTHFRLSSWTPTDGKDPTVLDRLLLDLRFALRALARRPAFSLVVVLALALGIGANAGIYCLANALLLRPPMADDPGRVVNLHAVSADGSGFHAFSYLDYLDYRRDNEAFDEIAAWNLETLGLVVPRPAADGAPTPRTATGQVVSENYFRVFGVEPTAGRFFRPEEGEPTAEHPALVVSHDLWSTDDAVELGADLLVNGHRMTVVGVAPPGFTGPFGVVSTELWVPFSMLPAVDPRMELEDRGAVWIKMVGRLAPGVEREEAESFLELRHDDLARAHPESGDPEGGVDVSSFGALPGQARPAVGIFVAVLMTVVTLLLLITGVNVAGMLLSRAAERRHESAIRLALGAGRHHLLRRWVVETTLLFALGAVLGTLVAEWAMGLLFALPLPLPVTLSLDVGLDHRVVLLVFALTLGTGVIFGLVPGLHAGRPSRRGGLAAVLRDDAASGGSGGRLRLRSAFVVAQVAAALVLLVLAGLFLRSLEGAREIDPGFTVAGVHVADLDLGLAHDPDVSGQDFYRRLVERAEAIPGVASASLVRMLHLGPGNATAVIHVPGHERAGAEPGREGLFRADQNTVSPGYFQTLEIPILRGRAFTAADRAMPEGGDFVTVVNRTLAERFWPGDDPLGRRIRLGGPDAPWATIVGVAADAKYRSLGEEPRLYLYFPLAQDPSPQMTLLARAEEGVPLPPDALRRLVAELDPSLPVLLADTLASQIGLALLPQQLASALAGGFGVLGLFLVSLGIYGITAFSVHRRTRELGVRRALGAGRREIVGLVLRQGLGLGVIGVVLGVGPALLGGRLASSLLVATSPTDPAILAGVAFLLLAAVAAGSVVPAWRAARVDPMEALRYQ